MKTADVVSSAVVVLFGLAILFVAIPLWIPVEAGPGFGLSATTMPNVAVVTATVLAALFFVYRFRNRELGDNKEQAYDAKAPIGRESWMFLLRGGLFLIAVTLLFYWIGFLVAGPLTVAGFMIMMGERRPLHVGITSIGAAVFIWLFFWQFLKFPLP